MNWKLSSERRGIGWGGILTLVVVAILGAALLAGALPGHAQSNPLTLADFDQSGLQVEILTLFVAGGSTTLYSAGGSRWGANGSLTDGDVELSVDSQIVRVMAPNADGSRLRLNDNVPLSLKEFFRASGAGADLTVWLQSASGTTSFAASDVTNAGSGYVNFDVPESGREIVTGICAGDAATCYVDASVSPSTLYVYSVVALSPAGEGAPSIEANATTPTPGPDKAGQTTTRSTGKVPASKGLTLTLTCDRVMLGWSAPSSVCTRHRFAAGCERSATVRAAGF